jgi:Acyl-CoA dehydrogenase, C-terminal domain
VNATFPQDVVDFAEAAQRRLARLGGVDFALRSEHDRTLRDQAGEALADLGAGELEVRADSDQFLAGAALCRASGAVALPWPVVEDLMRIGDRRLALVDLANPRVDHGDLPGEWLGSDLDGTSYLLTPGSAATAKLGPFLVPATTGAQQTDVPAGDIARHLVLGVWRLLGGLEAALAQVVDHVGKRTQFGKTLSEFQTVRFAVADATVALSGLEELAKYTTWRLHAAPQRSLTDAAALRLSGADTAVAVLRTCHQLLGAVGFCDEHDVSVFDRHLQPLIRLPLSAERLALRLVPAVRSGDFETLFS